MYFSAKTTVRSLAALESITAVQFCTTLLTRFSEQNLMNHRQKWAHLGEMMTDEFMVNNQKKKKHINKKFRTNS